MPLLLLLSSLLFIQMADYKVVTSQELLGLVETQSAQLVDVRTPGEWAKGYIKGASKINFYSNDFMDQLENVDKNEPVILYCAVGGRSAKAAEALVAAGYKKVYDYRGGFKGWLAEGRAVVVD